MNCATLLTAETLSEVCTDVCVEPSLQPLTGETFDYATANLEDGARVDVCQCCWFLG